MVEEEKEIRWKLEGNASPKTKEGIKIYGFYNKEVPQSVDGRTPKKNDRLVYVGRLGNGCLGTQPQKDPGSSL